MSSLSICPNFGREKDKPPRTRSQKKDQPPPPEIQTETQPATPKQATDGTNQIVPTQTGQTAQPATPTTGPPMPQPSQPNNFEFFAQQIALQRSYLNIHHQQQIELQSKIQPTTMYIHPSAPSSLPASVSHISPQPVQIDPFQNQQLEAYRQATQQNLTMSYYLAQQQLAQQTLFQQQAMASFQNPYTQQVVGVPHLFQQQQMLAQQEMVARLTAQQLEQQKQGFLLALQQSAADLNRSEPPTPLISKDLFDEDSQSGDEK